MKLTDTYIFTDPFSRTGESNRWSSLLNSHIESVYGDKELLSIVKKFQKLFHEKKEALIHGDLHTGSAMVRDKDIRVSYIRFFLTSMWKVLNVFGYEHEYKTYKALDTLHSDSVSLHFINEHSPSMQMVLQMIDLEFIMVGPCAMDLGLLMAHYIFCHLYHLMNTDEDETYRHPLAYKILDLAYATGNLDFFIMC